MTSEALHFSRSPLTEALIDIRVKVRADFPLIALAAIHEARLAEYPTRRDRMLFQGTLSLDPEAPPAIGDRAHVGYQFVSADERQMVQVSLDGFIFNRLAPYNDWQSFSAEARYWWRIYRDIIKPEAVTRLAVRYINRLDIPFPSIDLKDYLRTSPEISPDLPQGLSAYFMQLQIPQADIRGMLILNETLVPPPSSDATSVILDIDLFKNMEVPFGEEEIWDYFEQLRRKKNEVFLTCITERTKELIA